VIQTIDKAGARTIVIALLIAKINRRMRLYALQIRFIDRLTTLFVQFELYYDRRRGLYKDEGKPIGQIVSVLEVLQAMLAVVLARSR